MSAKTPPINPTGASHDPPASEQPRAEWTWRRQPTIVLGEFCWPIYRNDGSVVATLEFEIDAKNICAAHNASLPKAPAADEVIEIDEEGRVVSGHAAAKELRCKAPAATSVSSQSEQRGDHLQKITIGAPAATPTEKLLEEIARKAAKRIEATENAHFYFPAVIEIVLAALREARQKINNEIEWDCT